MPKCLSRKEIYQIISRELPPDTYAYATDPSKFLTTSDDDAFAKTLESAYTNACRVYENYFPQTTEEYIDKWEIKVFGQLADAASGLQARRDIIINKLRARKGIRKQDIEEIVQECVGANVTIEIIEFFGNSGSWILDVSELDLNTFLNAFSGQTAILSGPDLWEKSAAELGLTEDELEEYKREAYGYQVRLINYNASQKELDCLETNLTKYEPARSWHEIVNNATLTEAQLEWLLDFSELGESTFL